MTFRGDLSVVLPVFVRFGTNGALRRTNNASSPRSNDEVHFPPAGRRKSATQCCGDALFHPFGLCLYPFGRFLKIEEIGTIEGAVLQAVEHLFRDWTTPSEKAESPPTADGTPTEEEQQQ
jgi:hypothetical protein